MKRVWLAATLLGIALSPFAATNKVVIPADPLLDARATSAMPTNAPIALKSASDLVSRTDTNAILQLPYVQRFMQQVFAEGVQFGVAAALQNKTLVQMEDATALQRAALFMRFGAPQAAKH